MISFKEFLHGDWKSPFLREFEAAEPLLGEGGKKKKKKKRTEGGTGGGPDSQIQLGKGLPNKYNTTGSSGDVPYAI